ncbi:uncharacterized protein FA14DRAFT_156167 [Meira miltonrushii]|uniref:EXPERA domain-containing protein n=1 Tax=Meira miltonrushii TaxID=1280837 RepID=A0A316V7N8_9BASI|nr:uncharacterized protein FA14DRAFT_156167 [Meira miltonrushii]PWN33472.1 hypothetical protein FA14DRAFT_156167 [Meira miltonrushii]
MAAAKATTVLDPPKWILGWFIISSFIVMWDTGYILGRPHTFKGGKWHFLWQPYDLYGDVDLIYSKRFYELHNGFTLAQGLMNIVETILNFSYVYLAAYQSNARLRAIAPVIGFTAAIATFWKTVLYWAQDWASGPKGWGYTGHNTAYNFIVIFFLPNFQWILFPAAIAFSLGRTMSQSLIQAAGLAGPAGGTRSRTRKSSTPTTSRRKSVKAQ